LLTWVDLSWTWGEKERRGGEEEEGPVLHCLDSAMIKKGKHDMNTIPSEACKDADLVSRKEGKGRSLPSC